mmetsp:Transcript_80456/g.176403  ORF Transcript_80456/g.176403 Transcript_80456/m.176403 type:complete len:598 (-) Transcript_80456:157-1950(-)
MMMRRKRGEEPGGKGKGGQRSRSRDRNQPFTAFGAVSKRGSGKGSKGGRSRPWEHEDDQLGLEEEKWRVDDGEEEAPPPRGRALDLRNVLPTAPTMTAMMAEVFGNARRGDWKGYGEDRRYRRESTPEPRGTVRLRERAPQWRNSDAEAATKLKSEPSLTRITLPEDMALLHEKGLSPEVWLLVVHPPGLPTDISSNATHLLYQLLGEEESSQVELQHDPDWELYPEIGEAVKAAGFEEISTCLAIYGSTWAITACSKKKNRETAAKAALCCALMEQETNEKFESLRREWSAFVSLCESSGCTPDGTITTPAPRARNSRPPAEAPPARKRPQPPSTPPPDRLLPPPAQGNVEERNGKGKGKGGGKGKGKGAGKEDGTKGGAAAAAAAAGKAAGKAAAATSRVRGSLGDALRETMLEEEGEEAQYHDDAEGVKMERVGRDQPFWIELQEDAVVPDLLDGMSPEALCLATDLTGKKGLYGRVDEALNLVLETIGLPDGQEQIETQDDPDGSEVPAVADMLSTISKKAECYTVITLRDKQIWAVGLGDKARSRLLAAKVALTASLALNYMQETGVAVDFSNMAAWSELMQEIEGSYEQVG